MSTRVSIAPRALAPGDYELRVRASPAAGNREAAAADPRFRRRETLRLVVPASPSTAPAGARLLNRTGKPLANPITPSIVDEPQGSRWLNAQAALAPLAFGDYLLEVRGVARGVEQRTLVPFRVIS